MQIKIKILIIEDDLNQTFLIEEALDSELYEISNIQNGSKALAYLIATTSPPDLVLMDYHLPGLDGLMILQRLGELQKKFNIIFLTADYSIETAIKSINSGALEFIPKDGRFVNNIPKIVDKAYQTVKANRERSAFEKAYRESEARFKLVIDASKDGIFEWNSTTDEAHVSSNNATMLGFSESEFPPGYRGFVELIHPSDRQMVHDKLLEHVRHGTSFYEAELRLRTQAGAYKWVLQRGIVAETDPQAMPVRVVGTHSDISARKAAEEEMVEANRRLTTLISNLPGMVYRSKTGNCFLKEFVGGRVAEITGYTADELMHADGNLFEQLVHPADVNIMRQHLDEAIAGSTDYDMTYRIRIKTGEIRWMWDHGKVTTLADKDLKLEGYIVDITEKKTNEEALITNEEEKNIILDNSLQAFILLSPDGKIKAFNRIANHRTLLTVGKVIKKDQYVFDYFPENEKETFGRMFEKVINGEPSYWEQPFYLRGEVSWFDNVMVPVMASRERIKYVCFTSSDITEKKLAQEKIIYSESLYNSTINSLNDLLFVVDSNLSLVLINDAVKRFNIANELSTVLIGQSIGNVYPFFSEQHNIAYKNVFSTGVEQIHEDVVVLKSKSITVELKYTPVFQQSKTIRVVTVVRDITERKHVEKRIMNAIIETEERERKRFSEDLHDEMGAILSTIKIYINTLHNPTLHLDKKAELVAYTNQLIDQAIQNSKEIANNLSPNTIKRFGLLSALQSFCEKIQMSSDILLHFNAMAYKHTLGEDEEISIYRMVTELVNNTLKHGKASAIDIRFSSNAGKLLITYADNGKGFDMAKVLSEGKGGLGLQNILSRINSFDGNCYQDAVEQGLALRIELNI